MEKQISKDKPGRIETLDEKVIPFRPSAALLLDVSPIERTKPAETKALGGPEESPEEMLGGLLMRTEASAQRVQSSKMKWQLATLMLGMLLLPAILVAGWLYVETSITGTKGVRLEMENKSLREQVNTAGAQIEGFKDEVGVLMERNSELANEIAKLRQPVKPAPVSASAVIAKPQQIAPAKQIVPAVTPVTQQSLDSSRIDAMRKGKFPNGATKDELKAVLGEPDRVYNSRNYEQWVYFGQKSGRFWFIGNWLVQSGQ